MQYNRLTQSSNNPLMILSLAYLRLLLPSTVSSSVVDLFGRRHGEHALPGLPAGRARAVRVPDELVAALEAPLALGVEGAEDGGVVARVHVLLVPGANL